MINLPQASSRQGISGSDFTTAETAMKLDQLAAGRCGVVVGVDAQDNAVERLKAMGLCVGRKIEVIKRGHPLIVRVLGSRLGLSRRLAVLVTVETCSSTECVP